MREFIRISAYVKGCQMPATQHGTHRSVAVQRQSSEKPQGRKLRDKDAVLWGFEFGAVVRAYMFRSTVAMSPA